MGWAAKLLDSFVTYQTDNGVYGVVVVDQSWTIIRNFVNMFFILVLVVLAFGTIFDIDKYSVRNGKVLVSFIIAALLVNFSLVIGQYIITVANGISGVFLKSVGEVTDIFAQGTGQVKLATTAPSVNILTASLDVVINAVFGLIFVIIIFLAFLAAAIFSIARLFMLWFLLIISPIAWLGYAVPNLKGRTWSWWWEQFLCWCFWLPYFLFFVMFAAIFIANKDKFKPINIPAQNGLGLAGTDLMFYALSLVFLLGGMYMAKKLACASGTGVRTVFSKIEGGVRKYAPGAAYVRGAKEGLKAKGEEIQEKGVFGIGGAQKARETEAKARGWVAGALGVPGAREEASRAMSTEVDKEVKRLQTLNMTLDQLNQKLKSGSAPERFAALKLKAESGWLEAGDLNTVNKTMREVGGGRTATGASIIASLRKGKFHEMAAGTLDKERIFNSLTDAETQKAFGLDMAEGREVANEALAAKLLDLYKGDAQEVKKKVEDAVKNNIENFAKNKGGREALVSRVTTDDKIKKLQKLAGQVMVDKKEVDGWKTRSKILELNGGMDPVSGEAKTAEGRELAKNIGDNNVGVKEEGEYRKKKAIDASAILVATQRAELEDQIITNVQSGFIGGFSTEELKTPVIFNALINARTSGALTVSQFYKVLGVRVVGGVTTFGKGKPDRKRREAINALITAPGPMPYP